MRRKTYIKKKEDCISLNHTEIRVEKWAQVRHVLTHTESTLKKDLNLKKLSVLLFCPMGTCERTEQNLGARQKKRSARIPSDSQQKHGRKTTQHVNSGAVVKSPVDDNRRHR